MNYFHTDSQTRFIGLYLEDVRDGRRFLQAAGTVAWDKPVPVLKGGRHGPLCIGDSLSYGRRCSNLLLMSGNGIASNLCLYL
ncbi:MAG: hypothetical protein HQ517_17130 [SAR324 cluster bacterium]|nr:hypothetical protein [SAR324 cluster bacterium]